MLGLSVLDLQLARAQCLRPSAMLGLGVLDLQLC